MSKVTTYKEFGVKLPHLQKVFTKFLNQEQTRENAKETMRDLFEEMYPEERAYLSYLGLFKLFEHVEGELQNMSGKDAILLLSGRTP